MTDGRSPPFADAETALPLAFSPFNRPELVLTDVMLAGRSGLHLVGQLRSNPVTERLPVLVLTARGGSDAAADGLAAGTDDYISKPFSARELLARSGDSVRWGAGSATILGLGRPSDSTQQPAMGDAQAA